VRGNLLDTNVTLISLGNPDALSRQARKAIVEGPNYLSVISYWEVVLKSMKGNLDVGDPQSWWPDALAQLAAVPLLLRPPHIAAVSSLPPLHKDPFDRILIATAMTEALTLITTDGEIPRYASQDFRVIV
jgi:PIN domain nuclease of toxin-antitoxin system